MKQPNEQLYLEFCPVCESKAFDAYLETRDFFLTKEKFKIVQCQHCGHFFTNPIPELSKLPQYYESPEYFSHASENKSITGEIYKLIRDRNIKNKFQLVNSFKNGNSILDIGQGTGELLHYFKRKGWAVKGIEPNEKARNFAKQHYNIEVFDETFLDKWGQKEFDVITLWHVLEHVYDLENRMTQIQNLLKKDGYLFIAVPNIDSPDSMKYKEMWAGLDVPRHLSHFTKSSIKYLLNKHDFEIVDMYPMRFDAYYVSLLSEKYLNNKWAYFSAMLNGFQSNQKAKKTNNFSSMIFVAKQK